jgi:hypothetical protein
MKAISSLRHVTAGHAFVQNLRRGHYELTAMYPSMIACAWHLLTSRTVSNRGGHVADRVARSPPDRSTQQCLRD